jgi:Tfp pilus assembly protein PilO
MFLGAMAERRVISAELAALHLAYETRRLHPIATTAAGDFAQKLPAQPQNEAFTAELQRASAAAGVMIGSMQIQNHPARADQLARSDIAIAMKGRYPQLKQVVGEVLARFPNATLRRLSLRQPPPAVEAEASVVIVLWGRPASADSSISGGSR